MSARLGVLALQGDYAAHARALLRLGLRASEVRRPAQLESLDGIVIPGGESTTLLRLMDDEPWFPALVDFHGEGGVLFGTCAGAILLAREVQPHQASLGLLDVTVRRNAFGRQRDSFETVLPASALGDTLPAVFIRAPRFASLAAGVHVLATRDDEPVLVRQGRVLAATFHPELTADLRVHRYFLGLVQEHVRPAIREAS